MTTPQQDSIREALTVDQIRCEKCVVKISDALALIKGLTDARIEMGTSTVVVEYTDPTLRDVIDDAIQAKGFVITDRQEREPLLV